MVLDKPVRARLTPDPTEPAADLLSRCREVFGARFATVPQLDRETSGVVCFAERGDRLLTALDDPQAPVRRTFLGIVERAPPPRLESGDCTVDVRVVEERAGRVMIRAFLRSGRPSRVRGLFRGAGFPLAGDREGGVPAPRLMLHLARLEFAGAAWTAPAPGAMVDWLQRTRRSVAERLVTAMERRYHLWRDPATTAFRLAHGEADELPGLELDRYGDYAVVQVHEQALEDSLDPLCEAVFAFGPRGLYLKRRPVRSSGVTVEERRRRAPAAPHLGESAPEPYSVMEGGLPFEVQLGGGMSTGIFLDQRENRQRVRAASKDRAVLNLFGYTGAFSVAAAAGGARSSVTVDASAPALASASQALARFQGAHEVRRGDVFELLSSGELEGPFDLIVCDPPTFSRSRRHVWASGRGWVELTQALVDRLTPDGELLICSNDRRLRPEGFRRLVGEGVGDRGRIAQFGPPAEYPWVDVPHLKSAWVTASGRGRGAPSGEGGKGAGTRRGKGARRGGRRRPF